MEIIKAEILERLEELKNTALSVRMSGHLKYKDPIDANIHDWFSQFLEFMNWIQPNRSGMDYKMSIRDLSLPDPDPDLDSGLLEVKESDNA